MHLLAGLEVKRGGLRRPHLLPELDGTAHHTVDWFGERRSCLVDWNVQEAYGLFVHLLPSALPADATDAEPGNLIAAQT